MAQQRLYVGNLSYGVTEDDLRELFSQFGEVREAHLATERDTGRPRGFGFVEVENAQKAVESLDGHEFEGRRLVVNVARPRSER